MPGRRKWAWALSWSSISVAALFAPASLAASLLLGVAYGPFTRTHRYPCSAKDLKSVAVAVDTAAAETRQKRAINLAAKPQRAAPTLIDLSSVSISHSRPH